MVARTCEVCGGAATSRCAGCAKAFYCSPSCQRRGWKQGHKGVCGKGGGIDTPEAGSRRLPSERELHRCWGGCQVVQPVEGDAEDILLLLHGLGDTAAPFAALARKMSLPKVLAVALAGPIEVPLSDGGRAWCDSFDEEYNLLPDGHPRQMQSLERSLGRLRGLVLDVLVRGHGWPIERIHVLGFSQGGTIALRLALEIRSLGSVVAVSAGLPAAAGDEGVPAGAGGATPVMITHGLRDTVMEPGAVERAVRLLRSRGHPVEELALEDKGHGMIGGPREMRAIMAFWADHLHRRPATAYTPENGFVEVKDPEALLVSAAHDAARRVASDT